MCGGQKLHRGQTHTQKSAKRKQRTLTTQTINSQNNMTTTQHKTHRILNTTANFHTTNNNKSKTKPRHFKKESPHTTRIQKTQS